MTKSETQSRLLKDGASCKVVSVGKTAETFNQAVMQNPSWEGWFWNFQFTGKVSQWDLNQAVPQTDTGGLEEYSKVSERRMFQELGNKTTRNFGRWVACCSRKAKQVAIKICLPTVYQKHKSLQRRNPLYRGWRPPSAGKLRGEVVRLRTILLWTQAPVNGSSNYKHSL